MSIGTRDAIGGEGFRNLFSHSSPRREEAGSHYLRFVGYSSAQLWGAGLSVASKRMSSQTELNWRIHAAPAHPLRDVDTREST